MDEGRIHGTPPVPLPYGATRAILFARMRGGHSYSRAAGGFGGVPAMPPLQRFTAAHSPNSDQNVALVGLYGAQPGLFKQRLERMFNPSRKAPS